jgi:hypothetical protein
MIVRLVPYGRRRPYGSQFPLNSLSTCTTARLCFDSKKQVFSYTSSSCDDYKVVLEEESDEVHLRRHWQHCHCPPAPGAVVLSSSSGASSDAS